MRPIARVIVVAALGFASLVAHATPGVGWWWNPSESGRGFFIESQNGIFYLAGYFYDPSGRATWAVAGSPNADPYRFDGRLLAYANGQSLFGDYRAPSAPADVGAISVRFSDDTHGTLTWPGGTVAIERQVFGAGTPPFQPSNGWWWNEAESGRGYTIELQGDKLFVAGFMYDDAGNPVWYYSAGSMTSPTKYVAPWLQFANGQTMTGSYKPPSAPATVGQLEIEFVAKDQATMKFSDSTSPAAPTMGVAAAREGEGVPARAQPLASRVKIINVKRQFPDKPSGAGGGGGGGGTGTSFDPPPFLRGRFYEERNVVGDYGGASQTVEVRIIGENVVWTLSELTGIDGYPHDYTLKSGELAIEYRDYQFGEGFKCETPWTRTTFPLAPADGELEFSGTGNYRLKLLKYPLEFTAQRTCTTPDGSITSSIPHPEWSLSRQELGSVEAGNIVRKERLNELYAYLIFTGNITFTYYFEGARQ